MQVAADEGEGPFENALDLAVAERFEDEDVTAGEQRGDDLERGVLGGGADEDDRPRLDVGEEGILLRLVEAVDLVDKDDGPPALGEKEPAGLFHQLLDLGDFDQHGAERDEGVPGLALDDPGQRRLAGAGRAPEDARAVAVLVDHPPEHRLRLQQFVLAAEIGQFPGPGPFGQGDITGCVLFAGHRQLSGHGSVRVCGRKSVTVGACAGRARPGSRSGGD